MRCVSKRLRLLAAVLALGLAGYGRGHVARAAHARAYLSTPPMRFALHHELPAEACGTSCRVLISASGMITSDTPRDFENFARSRDVRGATIVLDSKGGSVLGAIALGRAIRSLGLATTVGRVREQPAHDGKGKRAWVWPPAAVDVAALRLAPELACGHVLDHALTQRADRWYWSSWGVSPE